MYPDELKKEFVEVREIGEGGVSSLYELAEDLRQRLYELLDDDGIVLLEKYISCIERLCGLD